MTFPYLLDLPAGYDKTDDPWPLVLFLHGAGESGRDLQRVRRHGPPRLVAAGASLPCLLASPQSPGGGWSVGPLVRLLDEGAAAHRVDPDRVYLTGLSMGGFGTWALAASHPERFAAIAPICGGGDPRTAPRFRGLPIWAFHGARDDIVPLEYSHRMVDALLDCGIEVKFTVYPDLAHDSWTRTYNDPAFWSWLLSQRRDR